MKKKIIPIVLCVFALLTVTQTTASADSGPKPSVVVEFDGLEQQNCYVTLLSKAASTGPHSTYNGNPDYARYHENDRDFEIWEKFAAYKDMDGLYFLQYFAKLDENQTFKWGYYPPQEFKILIYFPDTGNFAVSNQTYERYAFDSYYKVDASGLGAQPAGAGETFSAVRSHNYNWELISLVTRIVMTIVLEIGVALLFGFRVKTQILLIATVNIATQILLNILLNIINYNQGQMMFVLNYIWLELLVFAVEAVIYFNTLNKYGGKAEIKKWRPVQYALTANAVSFIAGLIIAHLIPGIF